MGESIGIYRKFKVRYYSIINLVDFMQRNPGAVSFGLNLINKR